MLIPSWMHGFYCYVFDSLFSVGLALFAVASSLFQRIWSGLLARFGLMSEKELIGEVREEEKVQNVQENEDEKVVVVGGVEEMSAPVVEVKEEEEDLKTAIALDENCAKKKRKARKKVKIEEPQQKQLSISAENDIGDNVCQLHAKALNQRRLANPEDDVSRVFKQLEVSPASSSSPSRIRGKKIDVRALFEGCLESSQKSSEVNPIIMKLTGSGQNSPTSTQTDVSAVGKSTLPLPAIPVAVEANMNLSTTVMNLPKVTKPNAKNLKTVLWKNLPQTSAKSFFYDKNAEKSELEIPITMPKVTNEGKGLTLEKRAELEKSINLLKEFVQDLPVGGNDKELGPFLPWAAYWEEYEVLLEYFVQVNNFPDENAKVKYVVSKVGVECMVHILPSLSKDQLSQLTYIDLIALLRKQFALKVPLLARRLGVFEIRARPGECPHSLGRRIRRQSFLARMHEVCDFNQFMIMVGVLRAMCTDLRMLVINELNKLPDQNSLTAADVSRAVVKVHKKCGNCQPKPTKKTVTKAKQRFTYPQPYQPNPQKGGDVKKGVQKNRVLRKQHPILANYGMGPTFVKNKAYASNTSYYLNSNLSGS